MGKTEYAGIDYGFGRTNFDKENGIRFGVISQHSLMPEAIFEDLEADYGDPTCGVCGDKAVASYDESVKDEEWNEGKDYACAKCKRVFWSDEAYPDEPLGWYMDKDGYQVIDCLDTDLMVIKSPYYTYAQYCSPCVPGAGNINSPCDAGPKSYCFGHDWFEGGKAPYTVYSVEDNEVIEPEEQ